MSTKENKTVLKNFPFKQQTTDYTCGPVCIKMCCDYFKKDNHLTELEIAKEVKTEFKFRKGTGFENMVKFFKTHKFKYISSIDKEIQKNRNKIGQLLKEEDEFKEFIIGNIKQGYPIIVRNGELGEHYRTIIGYIENGSFNKDKLIFAEPYDKYDKVANGKTTVSAEKFFCEWFGNRYVPKKWREQPFIVIMG